MPDFLCGAMFNEFAGRPLVELTVHLSTTDATIESGIQDLNPIFFPPTRFSKVKFKLQISAGSSQNMQ